MKNKKPIFNKQYSFYLTQEQYDAMREKAAKERVNVSVFIRQALEDRLNKK
jgi:hypothetical protein